MILDSRGPGGWHILIALSVVSFDSDMPKENKIILRFDIWHANATVSVCSNCDCGWETGWHFDTMSPCQMSGCQSQSGSVWGCQNRVNSLLLDIRNSQPRRPFLKMVAKYFCKMQWKSNSTYIKFFKNLIKLSNYCLSDNDFRSFQIMSTIVLHYC